MSLKSIREVTETTGITVNALRYYDSKGVLHPTERNPEGRKEWLYDDEAIKRAKRILLLRSIGIPVENIALVLESTDRMDAEILRSRLEELQEKRKALDEQISVANMLLMIDGLSAEEEIKEELLNRMLKEISR